MKLRLLFLFFLFLSVAAKSQQTYFPTPPRSPGEGFSPTFTKIPNGTDSLTKILITIGGTKTFQLDLSPQTWAYFSPNYFSGSGMSVGDPVIWPDTVKFQHDHVFNQNGHSMSFINNLSGGGQTAAIFQAQGFSFLGDTYNDNASSYLDVDSNLFLLQHFSATSHNFKINSFLDAMNLGEVFSGNFRGFKWGTDRLGGNAFEIENHIDSAGIKYRDSASFAKIGLDTLSLPNIGWVKRWVTAHGGGTTLYSGNGHIPASIDRIVTLDTLAQLEIQSFIDPANKLELVFSGGQIYMGEENTGVSESVIQVQPSNQLWETLNTATGGGAYVKTDLTGIINGVSLTSGPAVMEFHLVPSEGYLRVIDGYNGVGIANDADYYPNAHLNPNALASYGGVHAIAKFSADSIKATIPTIFTGGSFSGNSTVNLNSHSLTFSNMPFTTGRSYFIVQDSTTHHTLLDSSIYLKNGSVQTRSIIATDLLAILGGTSFTPSVAIIGTPLTVQTQVRISQSGGGVLSIDNGNPNINWHEYFSGISPNDHGLYFSYDNASTTAVKLRLDTSLYGQLYDGNGIPYAKVGISTGITALTGDATASGSGSVPITFATVNSNVGSFGDATHVPAITVNAKGLVTAVTSTAITVPTGANPTASIGFTPVNGGSANFTRADGAAKADSAIIRSVLNSYSLSAMQTKLNNYALLASPIFTGTPTLPTGTIAVTQSPGDNTTKPATTAFVTAAVAAATTGVSSVTAGNTSLTITPNTGAVIASLNLSNANTWGALQTFGTNINIGGVTATGATGTGSVVFGTSPTFTTKLTTPLILGGTGTGATLTLQSTSGVGVAGSDVIVNVGNNGGTEAIRVGSNGKVGILLGGTEPASPLTIVGGVEMFAGSTGGSPWVLSPAASLLNIGGGSGNIASFSNNGLFLAGTNSSTVATTARLQTQGAGTTSSNVNILLQNTNAVNLVKLTDDGAFSLYRVNAGTAAIDSPVVHSSGGIVKVISPGYYAATLPVVGTPTIVAGTGAGTSPTVSVTSNGKQLQVTVTTGTLPTGTNATVATVTLANALSYTPYPIFSPASANTSLLSGASMVYMTSTGTANVTITSGTTALTAATTYVWNIDL